MTWPASAGNRCGARSARPGHGHRLQTQDGSLRGGVGEAVTAFFNARGCEVAVHSLGIGDEWVEHGTPAQLYALCGYDEEGILRALLAAGK